MQGIVTDIRRFSLHDGPGIRTTIFLKGCNLTCRWCHNPETWSKKPQKIFVAGKCIGCGACYEACPTGALQMIDGERIYNVETCTGCGRCVDACFPGALSMSGQEMSVDDVMSEVLPDLRYYETSGGGVTISGGEPLLQEKFLISILERCRREEISTAIESNFCFPWHRLERVLSFVDLAMVDIKILDSDAHERWTGSPNTQILANIRSMDELDTPYIVRTPIIPTVNDNEDCIESISAFLADCQNLLYYELLNYNVLAESKFDSVGMTYELSGAKSLRPDKLDALAKAALRGAPHLDVRYQI